MMVEPAGRQGNIKERTKMIKFFAKLMGLERPNKSNWHRAMEAKGFSEAEIKKIVDEAREDSKEGKLEKQDTQEQKREEHKK